MYVGKLYPSRAVVNIPCNVKGQHEYAVARLSSFFRDCGLQNIVFMNDQESSPADMIRAALRKSGREGEWVGDVPEVSPVGESQSNGRAERAVQLFEDKARTHMAALEARLLAKPTQSKTGWGQSPDPRR